MVGDALKPSTDIGPVVEQQRSSTRTWTISRSAVTRVPPSSSAASSSIARRQGYYMAPALFTDATNKMRINREEIFGPVASVMRVKDYETRWRPPTTPSSASPPASSPAPEVCQRTSSATPRPAW